MVDAHCHLYEFDELDAVVQKAKEAGVDTMICAGADLASSKKSIVIAEKYPGVYATVGAHPEAGYDVKRSDFVSLLGKNVVGIGECGLDYNSEISDEDKAEQQELFKFNIDLAKETKLPLVVHCRNAFRDVFELLDYDRVQMHCFTGNLERMQECVNRSWYVSFGGIITFKKSADLREVVKQVPEDRLLIETDSPYLAPEPVRGGRNTPANVKIVAELVAKLRGTSINEIDKITTMNAKELFRL